jgi:hypothetical protein
MAKVCVAFDEVVTEIEAVKAPLKSKVPAPLEAVPMPKCVMVALPAVQGPNATAAAFDAFAPDTAHPAAERATACRA